MVDAVSTNTIPQMNPQIHGTGQFAFLNRPISSAYYESFNDSLFGSNMGLGMPNFAGLGGVGMGMGAGIGMVPGMGIGMGGYNIDGYIQNMEKLQTAQMDMQERMMNRQMDISQRMADRQTQLTFDQRGNAYTLQAHSESIQQQIARLAAYIQNNDLRAACDLYKKIYKTIDASVGEELNANSNRFDFNNGGSHASVIKNTIQNYYLQITGRDLVSDLSQNGSGEFTSMIKSWFGAKQPSAKEAISYMTGDSQQYGFFENLWRKLTRSDAKAEMTQTTSY